MSKYSNIWEPVYSQFEHDHPYLADKVVDWYPSAHSEIVVKLENGTMYKYDLFSNRLSQIYSKNEEETYLDEDSWRIDFSSNLYNRMRKAGFVRDTLAEATGISSVTIGKYLNGQTTPSGHNIYRIAKALRCSVSELMELR